MASTLPSPNACCTPCDSVSVQQVPGPPGDDGDPGGTGPAGAAAYTTFTADFTIPAELATGVATVATTAWMNIGQIVYGVKADGSVEGFFEVSGIGGATSVTLQNLENTGAGVYASNSAPGSIITSGSKLLPAGIQGPATNPSGAAGGNLKGTYPNPLLSVGNTKGSSLWGNGTDTVAVPAGTNGHMLAYDSTDAEGVKTFKALPLTGDTDLSDNRILRADGSAGLPVPAQPSRVTITDTGAVRADGSGGNARGTDAVDLQVTRAAATQVASGANTFIGGGQNNTASLDNAAVVGGQSNVASANSSVVAGGVSNQATAAAAGVFSGDTNIARSAASAVCGGRANTAGDGGGANARAFVGGGDGNVASGQESCITGGNDNDATGAQSAICGGDDNSASGTESFVGGGGGNIASGTDAVVAGGQDNEASANFSAVLGGTFGLASHYGQQAHAAGRFAADGDAQFSRAILRRATADATASELFLDGTSTRLTVPNNTSWHFRIMVVARTSAGLDAIHTSIGVIRNNAGTTSINGVTTTEVFDGAGLPVTPVVVSADDPNDALIITVTGIGATNIRWVATVDLTEVAF